MRNFWDRLSRREQGLVSATLLIIIVGACLLSAVRALKKIDRLDSRIGQLEQELINLTRQDALSKSAEIAFKSIASEHSSQWSKEEIEDRLGREIYKLALKDVDKKDPKQSDYLVQIPTLRAGTLLDDAEGYREFQTAFRLEPDSPADVLTFVGRLQRSRQSLRVDGLDISRRPGDTRISANLLITRTVLNSGTRVIAEDSPNLAQNAEFAEFHERAGFRYWETAGCEVLRSAEFATAGAWCLKARATKVPGEIFQNVTVEPNASYRLKVDIAADTPAEFTIRDGDAQLIEPLSIKGDGRSARYEIVFTTGESTSLALPYITLTDPDGFVYLDNVYLVKVSG